MPHARIRSAVFVLAASAFLICFGNLANHFINLAATISVYLLVTTAIADQVGFVEATIVSIVATLCLEYFFAPPLFSFSVDRSADWAALVTFEGISLMVSRLSHQTKRHRAALEKQNMQQKALYELCRDMLLLDWKQPPDQQLCNLIKNGFPTEGVGLWNAHDDTFTSSGQSTNAIAVTRGIYFDEVNYDDRTDGTSHRVLFFGTRAIGALTFYKHSIDPLVVNSITSLVAMVIERARSLSAEMNLEAEKQSEQLRSAVLDGLAHAFKTPLSTITLTSSGLLATQQLTARQSGLIELMNREANRLNELTTRLLRTSKLKPSGMALQEQMVTTDLLFQTVLEECGLESDAAKIRLQVAPEIKQFRCDPQLLSMALSQIVDNAVKYGREDSVVNVSAGRNEEEAVIQIHNEGSYIPLRERNKVFTRFYRSPSVEHGAPGTGLGLSVAKNAIEALGGRIAVESDEDTGTRFTVTIPAFERRTA